MLCSLNVEGLGRGRGLFPFDSSVRPGQDVDVMYGDEFVIFDIDEGRNWVHDDMYGDGVMRDDL